MVTMIRETLTHQKDNVASQRHSVARWIAGLAGMDHSTTAMVRSLTGTDPSLVRRQLAPGMIMNEGLHGGLSWVSIVAQAADGEARSLYGDDFAVRVPVATARHADRDCAVAMAILASPISVGHEEGLAAA